MKRKHFFELHEQKWCAPSIRNGLRDMIQFVSTALPTYTVITPQLVSAMQYSNENEIVDLCSGAGGPWKRLIKSITVHKKVVGKVKLTDLYPDVEKFKDIKSIAPGIVSFSEYPVDATQVPSNLSGFRTIFAAFHHFKVDTAREIIRNAVSCRVGIGIYEITERSMRTMLFVGFTSIFWVLIGAIFLRPVRLANLFWTFVIPVLPFMLLFDGVISCLRTYSPDELREMVASLDTPDYKWHIGKKRERYSPFNVTYLVGYPI